MKQKEALWGTFIVLLLLTGCGKSVDHHGKTPLVEAGGVFLYREDLVSVIPPFLKGKDSTRFAESYIREWIEDALLFQKAEGNIPDNAAINERVAAYRRALIMHTYEEELVRQEVGEQVSDAEIEQYYQQNKERFRADQPYIQGLFLKVPLHAPQLGQVRAWCKKMTEENMDKLEKYSIGNAVSYDSFLDRWRPVSEYTGKLPLQILTSDPAYLDRNRNVEVRDTAFCYFLHVEDYLAPGGTLPLEHARNGIKEILINLKRVDYINRMKQDLYKTASENKEIIYY